MKTPSAALTPQDITTAMTSPTIVFDTPFEVVQRLELTRAQKIEILKRWELDARALQRATDENMSGGEAPPLDDVNTALLMLDPDDTTKDQFGKVPTAI
jgi:ABC-type iron transport system FetAB ATPase subunit